MSSICVTVFVSVSLEFMTKKLAVDEERDICVQKFRLLSLISWINMGLTFSWPFLMENCFIILRVRARRSYASGLTLTRTGVCDVRRCRTSRSPRGALENSRGGLCGRRKEGLELENLQQFRYWRDKRGRDCLPNGLASILNSQPWRPHSSTRRGVGGCSLSGLFQRQCMRWYGGRCCRNPQIWSSKRSTLPAMTLYEFPI